MKKVLILFNFFLSLSAFGQSFNEDKTSMTNFIKRMYKATPFDGVKIIDDYDHQYLVSVLSMDKTKYTNSSIMNRVAQVKAQSQANTFLNGATISIEMVVHTKETVGQSTNTVTVVESLEKVKQNSVGFTKGLELLTNYDSEDGLRAIFVYSREILNEPKKN
jgi:6-pyruvoyl-tetrahydropterin synthase